MSSRAGRPAPRSSEHSAQQRPAGKIQGSTEPPPSTRPCVHFCSAGDSAAKIVVAKESRVAGRRMILPPASLLLLEAQPQRIVLHDQLRDRALDQRRRDLGPQLKQHRLVPVLPLGQLVLEEPALIGVSGSAPVTGPCSAWTTECLADATPASSAIVWC